MRVFVSTVVGWAIGFATYVLVLRVVYGQTMSGGDLRAVVLWSAIAFFALVPVVYLPAMSIVKRLLGGYQPVAAFALVAALLGVAPTGLIMFVFGGNVSSLLSQEAVLFYSCFALAGVVFGVGISVHRGTGQLTTP